MEVSPFNKFCIIGFGFQIPKISVISNRKNLMTTTINLKIPFESLSEVINSLDLAQKQQLLEILEQQIFEEEEASYQDDDETLAELQKVRDEYQSGDYVTLEQYLSKD
jgi:predicted CopG family antitoxin